MKWLAVFVALIAVVYVAFKTNFPTYTYRYRLQVALSIDEKVHAGSSVIEVVWKCGPKISGLGRCASTLRGQAAVIDIGSRGVIVAALRSGYSVLPTPADRAVGADALCANAFGNGSTDEELPLLPGLTGRRGLDESNFPRLIWFSNPIDPTTATKVMPRDIGKIVDPTAHFTDAFVEITKDPIVIDISKTFPWFTAMQGEQKSGKRIFGSEPGQLNLFYNLLVGEDS
jgi:hypothetical protein